MTQPTTPAAESDRPPSTVARHSLSVAAGAAASRATGLGRMAVAAAVLGPTFLANIYSTMSLLPGLLHMMMAGPLVAALIIPPLVRHLDRGDQRAASRLANAAFGLILSGFLGATALALIASPLLKRLLLLSVPPELQEHSAQAASILLMLMLPQLICSGITSVAISAQQARGRFGFPAAAQIVENLGVITVLLIARAGAPAGYSADTADTRFLLTIGLGTTAAAVLQAFAQWLGARAAGLTLRPTFRWDESDIREILRLALPSIGTATIGTFPLFALVIVAGLVPGGVIAMHLGVQFSMLPIAMGAQPISQALLPHLARLRAAGDPRASAEYRSAVGMALWVAVPAALGLFVLSGPIARVVALGEMANPRGVELIRVAISAYGLAVPGLAVTVVAAQAAYASRDAFGPFRNAVLRALLVVPMFAVAAFWARDTNTLWLLGLGAAVAETTGAIVLDHRVRSGTPNAEPIVRWIARDLVLGALAVSAAWGVQAALAEHAPAGRAAGLAALLAAAAVGFVVYVSTQLMAGAPEFAGLGSQLRLRLPWVRQRAAR